MSQCRRGEHFRHLARVIHTKSCSDSTILLVSQSVSSISCFIPDALWKLLRKVQPLKHTPHEQNATNHCLLRIPRIPTDHFYHELSSSRMNSPCQSFPCATCNSLSKRDLKTRFRRCDE